MDAFAFETAEEVFGNGVVIRITLAGHTLPDAEIVEALLVSEAYWRPRSEWKMRPWEGLRRRVAIFQCGEGKVGVDAIGEGVTDDLLCAKVFHNGAVEPALIGRDISNVADPGSVRHGEREAAREEVRRDGMGMPGVGGGFVGTFAC